MMEPIPSIAEAEASAFACGQQTSAQSALPVILGGVVDATIPIPSKEEQEEEAVDYSGEDDADLRLSPNIDSPAKDLTVISPLPAQEPTAAAPCGTTSETVGEWSSLVGVAQAEALATPCP
ncbi:uncharacterized protein A4U43_C01F24510 [Asparagus officinalis]|uniref:Uncharacterized protein n=1 Tax=Asparagus officinalis TaxID=4686 RepID=A0A5P1FSF9_ASPOF|nr:uncharacterized protein A4U43_C01F24510 [Asparagus officinalis]